MGYFFSQFITIDPIKTYWRENIDWINSFLFNTLFIEFINYANLTPTKIDVDATLHLKALNWAQNSGVDRRYGAEWQAKERKYRKNMFAVITYLMFVWYVCTHTICTLKTFSGIRNRPSVWCESTKINSGSSSSRENHWKWTLRPTRKKWK